jgi:hypothetical protein
MPVLPSSSTCAGAAPFPALHPAWPAKGETRLTWAVARAGSLVPPAFDGSVFAVFARAAWLACGDGLLVLAAPPLGDGPATLVLASRTPPDLRDVLARGEPIRCRAGCISARGATFDRRGARTWFAPRPRPALAWHETRARVELADDRLARQRSRRSSVLAGAGAQLAAHIGRCCREQDIADALRAAAGLVGWGEGLTPAGDDFLVGLCSALQSLSAGDAKRLDFVARMRQWLGAQGACTTPIAAHFLGLAARGHFNAGVLRAIDALRCESDLQAAQRVLDAMLQFGATSGADTLTGILAGFRAWTDPPEQENPS